MTPAIFSFTDKNDSNALYIHCDGDPEGAAVSILKAFYRAWTLPRFEANELSAAMVAANKMKAGHVRLVNSPVAIDQCEFVYEIFQAKNGQMIVKAFEDGKEFFYGRLKDFCLKYNPDAANDIVNVFHGEFTDAENSAMEAKKSEIRRLVNEALGKLDKIKDELENIVTVGE